MKTYFASCVPLSRLPDHHRGNNGNCQCNILIRARSKKRVSELVDCGLHYLNNYSGLRIEERADHVAIPKADETVYYQPGCTKSGTFHKWFEYNA